MDRVSAVLELIAHLRNLLRLLLDVRCLTPLSWDGKSRSRKLSSNASYRATQGCPESKLSCKLSKVAFSDDSTADFGALSHAQLTCVVCGAFDSNRPLIRKNLVCLSFLIFAPFYQRPTRTHRQTTLSTLSTPKCLIQP